MFFTQLLESMGVKNEYSILVQVDNVGAIFMSNNVMTTCHTSHLDIHYKCINEYAEDRIIKINLARIKTKIVTTWKTNWVEN